MFFLLGFNILYLAKSLLKFVSWKIEKWKLLKKNNPINLKRVPFEVVLRLRPKSNQLFWRKNINFQHSNKESFADYEQKNLKNGRRPRRGWQNWGRDTSPSIRRPLKWMPGIKVTKHSTLCWIKILMLKGS